MENKNRQSIKEHIEAYKKSKAEEAVKKQVLEHAQTHGVKILDYKNVEEFTAAGNRVQLEAFYSKLRASKLLEADDQPVETTEVEAVEDDIKVEVDGETVVDTATDDIESSESALQSAGEGTVEEYGPKLGITDMLLLAINDENTTIQAYNSLIATCNEEGFEEIAKVIKHINEEENIHVGMLQYAMGTISEQAKTIQTGNKEAEEIINGNEDANHEEIQASEEPAIVEEHFLGEELNLDKYGKAAKRAIKNLVLDSDEELREFVNAIIDEIIAEKTENRD